MKSPVNMKSSVNMKSLTCTNEVEFKNEWFSNKIVYTIQSFLQKVHVPLSRKSYSMLQYQLCITN